VSDDDLRAWRDAYRAGLPGGGPDCPADETLAALVVGELLGDERLAVADHVVSCLDCTSRHLALLELHQAARRTRPRWAGWVAAAAAAVAVAVAGAFVVGSRTSVEPAADVLRAPGEDARPPAGAVLAGPPRELSWTPLAGATSHRVRLFDAGGDLVWESDRVVGPPLILPPETAARLAAGRSYFWTVELEGAARERLGPYWFRLAPSP
jgi:hypothetical protein